MKYLSVILLIGSWSHLNINGSLWNESFIQTLPGSDIAIEMKLIPHEVKDQNGMAGDKASGGADYYISEYEVTWDLYSLYLDRTIDEVENTNLADQVGIDVDGVTGATVPYVDMSMGMGTEAGMPVCNVTALSASRFCQWLSAKTGRFYRLPTEKEWEKAALAGAETRYFFGEDSSELDAYAWYSENSDNKYHQVGTKKPNSYGLYDVYGNVAEWAITETKSNPKESGDSYTAVLKGGGYHMPKEDINTESRLQPSNKWKERDPQFPRSKWWYTDAGFVGFRIVSPVNTPPESKFYLYWNIE